MFCIFSIKLRKQKLHKYLSCSLVSVETSKLTRLIWPKINPVKAIVFAMKEGCTVNTQRCNIFFLSVESWLLNPWLPTKISKSVKFVPIMSFFSF